jgi:hypothetical protein
MRFQGGRPRPPRASTNAFEQDRPYPPRFPFIMSNSPNDQDPSISLSTSTFIWTVITTSDSTTITLTKTWKDTITSTITGDNTKTTSEAALTLGAPTTRASDSSATNASSSADEPAAQASTSSATSTFTPSEIAISTQTSNIFSSSTDLAVSSTTSAPGATSVASQTNSSGMSQSALAGIVIGTALATFLLTLVFFLCRRRRRRRALSNTAGSPMLDNFPQRHDQMAMATPKSPTHSEWSPAHRSKLSDATSTRTSNTLVPPTSPNGYVEDSPTRHRSGQSGQWLPMINELSNGQQYMNEYHSRRLRETMPSPSPVNSSVVTFGSAAEEAEHAQIGRARIVRISRGR